MRIHTRFNYSIIIATIILLNTSCSSSVEEVSKPLIDLPVVSAEPVGGTYVSGKKVTLSCKDYKGKVCTTYYSTKINDVIEIIDQEYTSKIVVLPNQKTEITFYGYDGKSEGKSVRQVYIID